MRGCLIGLGMTIGLLFSGCIVRPNPNGSGPSGESAIIIANHSSGSICRVRFSPTSEGNWGEDRLGSDQIAPGASHQWPVAAGSWDVRLETCDQTPLAEHRNVSVNGPTEISYP